jgi:inhibitor of KinA
MAVDSSSKIGYREIDFLPMLSQEPSYPRFQLASDCSLLVTFGDEISRKHHSGVARLFELLRSEQHPAIRNIHPAYSSLLVSFDPLLVSPGEFETFVQGLVNRIDSVGLLPLRSVKIPVCYDSAFAPDLQSVAAHNNISIEEAIQLHSSPQYLVYFLGFAPGFPYLGELPARLATPRFPTPRVKIPAGSVAIGGNQTGIYPVSTPGGWRIIGRTPLTLFQVDRKPPALLQMGDTVQFNPITREEFDDLSKK